MTKSQTKRLRRALFGLFAILVIASGWTWSRLSSDLERATLDFRYAHNNRDAHPTDQVVLIDIDEQSIKNLAPVYGRWPWPRRIYKDMISFLSLGEPSAILFDVLFTEEQQGTDDDAQFAEATATAGTVSHALQFLPESSREGVEHIPLNEDIAPRFGLKWAKSPPQDYRLPFTMNDFLLPNPTLLGTLPRLHVVNVDKDSDGILRRVPLVFHYDKAFLPSLVLSGVISQLKDPKVHYEKNQISIYEGSSLKWKVPLDENNLLPLHFYADRNRPKTFRMSEVIESAAAQQRGEEDPAKWAVNPLDLAGKIILVGTSATGLEDLKATPVAKSYPGVLLHTTGISNIIKQDFLKRVPVGWALAAGFLFALIAYTSVFFLESIALKTILPLGAMIGYGALSLWLFQTRSMALNMSVPLLVGTLAFIDSFIYMSFVEGRERKRMTGALSKYLSPDVANQLAENGVDPTAEVGTKRELSVLFSDVRGFTTLSEKLQPEMVVTLLNEYLGHMTDVIFNHGGTLDKFIGDAVMAFWGAPVENPRHALEATRTAIAMRDKLVEINRSWEQRGLPLFQIGIGINTGPVIVGNIGSEKRLDYTVIGDNVNLASRLEGLTKLYHVEILIGPSTYEQIRNEIVCRPLDLVRVKGKYEAVKVYEPLVDRSATGSQAETYKRLAERFTEAWDAYERGEFQRALSLFNEINTATPGGDGPSQVYAERCFELMSSKPETWDGVYVAKTK